MQVQTARFVNLSDVFEGFPKLEKLFNEADHSFTWGAPGTAVNRSMISRQTFLDEFSDQDMIPRGTAWLASRRQMIMAEEWDRFCARLADLPDDVYIDLEN